MRTKRIFAVVVALGLVAGNVWPHDIASDIDVETLLGTSRGEITRVSVAMEETSSGEEYRMSPIR